MKTLYLLLALCSTAFGFTNKTPGIYQSGGSASDTQAAINAAADGDTVTIPDGTWEWSHSCAIDGKSIHLKGQSKAGTIIKHNFVDMNSNWNALLYVRPSTHAGHNIEVSDLTFQEGPAIQGVGHHGLHYIQSERLLSWPDSGFSPNVSLVHDCLFQSHGNMDTHLIWVDNGGVLWNCTFEGSRSSDAAISTKRSNLDTFMSPSTMGTLDTTGMANTYVEDCAFNDTGPVNGCVDVDDGGRIVFRHCAIHGGMIGTHGADTSPYGFRHFEIYDCVFDRPSPDMLTWVSSRGATFVIHDCQFAPGLPRDVSLQIQGLRRKATGANCATKYPVVRQIGQGWCGCPGSYSYPEAPHAGSGYILDPIYIWNSPMPSGMFLGPDYEPDECGNGLYTRDFVKKDRDYYLDTPKPGYTAYQYPHPLRAALGGGGPTPTPTPTPGPTATPNPSPSPTPPRPTPTPGPTATPSPTPGATYQQWLNEESEWIRTHPPTPDK
jgi:hypothetical protein